MAGKNKLNKFQQHIRDHGGLEPQEREAELLSVDEENRTATFSFSSEYEVPRWWGVEILDHQPASVRMERINNGGAFLMDHNRRDQRGVVLNASIVEKRGHCTIKFSQSVRGEELWVDVKDRIRTQVSVSYVIHEAVLERKEGDQEFYRVTDWEPTEISSVSIAADPSVGLGRSAENQTYLPVNLRLNEEGVPAMEGSQRQLRQRFVKRAVLSQLRRLMSRAKLRKLLSSMVQLNWAYALLGRATQRLSLKMFF